MQHTGEETFLTLSWLTRRHVSLKSPSPRNNTYFSPTISSYFSNSLKDIYLINRQQPIKNMCSTLRRLILLAFVPTYHWFQPMPFIKWHSWSIIKNAIYSGMNLFIPKGWESTSFHAGLPLNSDISQNVYIRILRKRISKHPSPQLFDKLSQMEDDLVNKPNPLNFHMKAMQLIHSFARKCNTKIYDYINWLTNCCRISPLVYLCSSQISSDRDRAALFNSLFHSVFTVSHFTLPSSDNLSIPPSITSDLHKLINYRYWKPLALLIQLSHLVLTELVRNFSNTVP